MIAENIADIQVRVKCACTDSKRDINEIRLIAISKHKTANELIQAYNAGVRDFGENYLQEALQKIKILNEYAAQDQIIWHYTGRLQTKKLKEIVRRFQVIHSLDHLLHAERLNALAKENGIEKLHIFIQVNLDRERQKGGVCPEELESFLRVAQNFENLDILGLMLIPKPGTSAETLKKFKEINFISKRLASKTGGQLSMGMSQDYALAIAAGATHLRIGTAIFGER